MSCRRPHFRPTNIWCWLIRMNRKCHRRVKSAIRHFLRKRGIGLKALGLRIRCHGNEAGFWTVGFHCLRSSSSIQISRSAAADDWCVSATFPTPAVRPSACSNNGESKQSGRRALNSLQAHLSRWTRKPTGCSVSICRSNKSHRE